MRVADAGLVVPVADDRGRRRDTQVDDGAVRRVDVRAVEDARDGVRRRAVQRRDERRQHLVRHVEDPEQPGHVARVGALADDEDLAAFDRATLAYSGDAGPCAIAGAERARQP